MGRWTAPSDRDYYEGQGPIHEPETPMRCTRCGAERPWSLPTICERCIEQQRTAVQQPQKRSA